MKKFNETEQGKELVSYYKTCENELQAALKLELTKFFGELSKELAFTANERMCSFGVKETDPERIKKGFSMVFGTEVSLYFQPVFKVSENEKPYIELNYGTCGSFGKGDDAQRLKCQLLGFICVHFEFFLISPKAFPPACGFLRGSLNCR